MKKIFLTLVFVLGFLNAVNAQLIQSNFQGVLVPRYIGSGTATRLPYILRATITGLQANSKYRYYTNACRYTDFGSSNSGAGNPIFINGTDFRYSTSTGLNTVLGYDSIITDASGSYTGWFGFVNTGNARFTAGNYVYPSVTLDSVGNGVTKYRFALNDSIKVLQFADSANANSGTGMYGISLANPKNVISVYDNVNNTGRPLSMVYAESDGIDTTLMTSLVQYYKDSVNARNGRWGTLIPNLLSSGVRRINVHYLSSGLIANFQTDTDGIWPSGVSTINPAGGSVTPIRLNQTDVPLIVNTGISNPSEFALAQNYPNPFNPVTTIDFSIPASGNIKLKVYNMLGKEMKVLADGSYNSGTYSVIFNAGDLNSGVYFYSLEYSGSDGNISSDRKKLLLIK